MTPLLYYIISAVLSVVILYGISLMSQVKTAVRGNQLSALATAAAIITTLIYFGILSVPVALVIVLIGLALGAFAGIYLAQKVKMIQMPEMVGMLNGVGGAASALVGGAAMFVPESAFSLLTAVLALLVGTLTFTGSAVAAAKLAGIINGRPIVWRGHQAITLIASLLMLLTIVLAFLPGVPMGFVVAAAALVSAFWGIAVAVRVGGADMPITISLLNSFSGVAGSIAGMAIGDILLVSVGGIVGASGLLLTQIMCRAMNASLADILLGKTSVSGTAQKKPSPSNQLSEEKIRTSDPAQVLGRAKKVIIVPGYGMAIAQAQHLVKELADTLEAKGAQVKYAIHPVAGRMPGHMNVLLSEADVPYEQLYEMDDINEEFATCDACLVVGANDVMNPAARDSEDTPISGMPILNVDMAPEVIICNYDLKPGYAGVENPIYSRQEGLSLLLGNAADTLQQLLADLKGAAPAAPPEASEPAVAAAAALKGAKKVIIVPGYGMAIAQAQHLVKQLADALEALGTEVKNANHPVAGRMPGHMNVLLSEADVPYEQLYEMDDINEEFAACDACLVVGANDVMNPAARESEDTPISGMPILNVDMAPKIVICNYDLKPGYAGVENPIYTRKDGVVLLLGNAADTLQHLLEELK